MERPAEPKQKHYPLLPLRDIVLFPGMLIPLTVGRPQSVKALEAAERFQNRIFMLTQLDPEETNPTPDKLHRVGTVAEVLQVLRLNEGRLKVLVEGQYRATVTEFFEQAEYTEVEVDELTSLQVNPSILQETRSRVLAQIEYFSKLSNDMSPEFIRRVRKVEDVSRFVDMAAGQLTIPIEERQKLLEMTDPLERIEMLSLHIDNEIELIKVDKRIKTSVKKQMEQAQREYFLNEQMKAIRKELGRKEDGSSDIEQLRSKIKKAGMPRPIEDKALNELSKLETMAPMFAEASVVRNYLDWLIDLPWKEITRDNLDITHAMSVLEEDHYGLKEVKERIIEYLAVQKRVGHLKGPILCFVGPPGVGKTSLGKSIARAMGRKFVRISLGGVRDEAEVRGHRRTYIGSMPGRIIQGMKKAGTVNPVFLFDEIDKLGWDHRGDPASAMLEVLDPEQNSAFNDHYLEVDYDLSKVLFICTANMMENIPRPLLDRMELIRLPGYTEDEKTNIARRHLLPKVLKDHGLEESDLTIPEDSLRVVLDAYTREAGVRTFERNLSALCRKVAVRFESGTTERPFLVSPAVVREFLGPEKFKPWPAEEEAEIGVCTGMAWTEVGGTLMTIEVSKVDGKGALHLTGKLGDVMKESANAAMTYIRSRARQLGLDRDFYHKWDFHLHVPEGAVPKDGPSAGITIATALTSVLTGRAVRSDVAMTGEVTLRGRVLKIGGLKEKCLAAHRAGIFELVIPKDNEPDLEDIPDEIRKLLRFHLVAHMDEVLAVALTGEPLLVRDDLDLGEVKLLKPPAIPGESAAT